MTKGQAARALASAIGELKDVDVQLQNLFTEADLKWTDFEGPASSRLFQAICRASSDQLRVLVAGTAKQYRGQQEELQSALSQYLALPGTVWDGRIARELNKACPYPGMRSFTSPKGFYGREELSAQIRHKSDQNPLILVTGASGSGKSSVVMAGVFPAWKKDYGEETTFQIRPEGDPFKALYNSLFQAFGQVKAEQFQTRSRDVFMRLATFLSDEGIRSPLFFVDPFEKVFAAESDTSKGLRDDFVASLVDFAQRNSGGARLILGMRDDFLGALSKFPHLCRFTDANLVRVFPLDEDSLRQAIQHPAADHGVDVEEHIVDDIVDKVLGRSGMLPLMQDVLKSLWENEANVDLVTTRRLTANSYFELGGVLGSLTKRLDALCVERGDDRLRRIFLRTVQVATDQTTPAISRRGHREELSESDQVILDELIDKKVLVTFDPEPGQTQGTFGLPHEAVIQNWTKLKAWITDSRHLLTLLSRLNEDVRERQRKFLEHPENAAQIDQECLWRGGRLDDLSKLAESDFEQLGFTTEMKEFLDASQKQQEEEQKREIRLAQEREAAANERAETARKNAENESLLKRRALMAAAIAIALMFVALFFKAKSDHETKIAVEKTTEAQNKSVELKKKSDELEEKSEELEINLEEAERRVDLNNLREASRALAERHPALAEEFLEKIKLEHRYTLREDVKYPCFVWNYNERQARGDLFSLYGHTDFVSSVAFSPDGLRIATGSNDKTARVWDARTGQSMLKPLHHNQIVSSVAFSPDGLRIVTGSWDMTARVWDARTGQSLLEPLHHKQIVSSVAFSPDGLWIVTGSNDNWARWWDAFANVHQFPARRDDNFARVWDARTGQLMRELLCRDGVNTVAFSPDGLRIITVSDEKTAVWDAQTGQFLFELQGHAKSVKSAAFSPDGLRIVTGSNDMTAGVWDARVWDARTGQPLLELRDHKVSGQATSVAFSPDGSQIVTGSGHKNAWVWDARTGLLLFELEGNTNGVTSVAFSSDGLRIATGSNDKTARVWDVGMSQSGFELKGHAKAVTSVAFSPDGLGVVTGSDDSTARLWDARTGQLLRELKGQENGVRSVAFSPDGRQIVTGSKDTTVRVLDVQTREILHELPGHKYGVSSVAFSPDGLRIVTGLYALDNSARLWDAQTGEFVRELPGHKYGVSSVAFSPDGLRLVTGSYDGTARVWNTQTGESLHKLKFHRRFVNSVAFSPDGLRIVTGSSDMTARVWDARTGQSLLELQGHANDVSSVAFSPDSLRIVTGSKDMTARVWDARTGQSLLELQGHAKAVTSVAFSPDGLRIVTGSDDETARVWNARPGQSPLELQGHANDVSSVAFSPDGLRIVTGSKDETARVWDARTGRPLLELQGHSAAVNNVAFSPDGLRIVTASLDKTARVWDARAGQSLLELSGQSDDVSSVAFSPDGLRIVAHSFSGNARVWDANNGTLIPNAQIPETVHPSRVSPDEKYLLLERFKNVIVVPLDLTAEEKEERKARTRTRPDIHRMQAERFGKLGLQFAHQVQRSLEQLALGQEKVDENKPEEAEPFFAKAKELWPKPIPFEVTPPDKPVSEKPANE